MRSARRSVVFHGMIAGAIGYAVVAILFGVVDFLLGQPVFATAAHVGMRITGWVSAALPGLDPAPVLAVNALHLVVMLGAGLLGSLPVHRSRRVGLLPVFAFLAGAIAALLAAFALAAGLLGAAYGVDLAWISLAAAAATASYLLVGPRPPPPASRAHPACVLCCG